MTARLVLFITVTLLLIAFDWYRHKEWRKSVLATVCFVWLLCLAFAGFVMRPILPLFVLHIVFVLAGWLALMWYLFKGRFIWWVFMLPVLSMALFVLLNFMEGSRYER